MGGGGIVAVACCVEVFKMPGLVVLGFWGLRYAEWGGVGRDGGCGALV